MGPAFFTGLGTGLSLIVAIGAQNAFVLKQGLLRSHVFAVCLFCAVSDALLIAAGVAGAGALAQAVPWFLPLMRWGGAAFLIWYGARAFRAAATGQSALRAAGGAGSLGAALATVAALTWLNPHVYLDTVVLLGAVSARFADKGAFAAGAMSGSFLFFFSLGYGARWLAPLFARPRAWQVLDVLIGLVMWSIALALILNG
ncbi:MAG: LysE/ArgO family amino acid transporter [Paracoccus sp. (in: a-proteobacteria)]|uniref:LysE/ArgO family amino acid transporter n=1 Tax=Paracoccus sp. TaxID=267 RepID=UPI0026E0B9B5|nr:LysE/ArgO family amino acid transporter [Paracoccus sp. (in: a-proteobacteria)]MDO5612837.1 LysE/ArgO family amino acid transporter [Paracoccus sp. (in: a-proteobacteria)]